VNILFLYTELAGYFLSCVNELTRVKDVTVHIVRWPVNKEAPFQFEFSPSLKVYDRNDYDLQQLDALVKNIAPDFIYCSGWIDKDYLKVARKYRKTIPVVVGFDNQWTGTLKQRIAAFLAPFTIRRIFNHCWVPGQPQERYAVEMGFKADQIMRGFYSADVDHFDALYKKFLPVKSRSFPRRFIFSGRYVEYKGLNVLIDAFDQARNELGSDWELWCLGTGPLQPKQADNVKHLGFIQPAELEKVIAETGVFVLPSSFEPWGVVVHEFAAAGFPLICSDAVGASTQFLQEGVNGFTFAPSDVPSLKKILISFMKMSDPELLQMSDKSNSLSFSITPQKWVGEVLRISDIYRNVRN
jgi:glycosyltransferase involved in cell wall biosynthesis